MYYTRQLVHKVLCLDYFHQPMSNRHQHIGIIVLAAGSSSRLGTPKQLLPTSKGDSLIRRTAKLCIGATAGPVVAVTGAQHEAVVEEIADLDCTHTYNSNWPAGMGTSISHGMEYLQAMPVTGIIVTVCDQPHLSSEVFSNLMHLVTAKPTDIIMCKYAIGQGPPCYFPASYAPMLSSLRGDEGARTILASGDIDVLHISFPDGHKDIDTPSDIRYLQ